MFDASRRPMRRLFYFWAAPVVSGAMVISTFGLAASGLRRPAFPRAAAALPQGGPALTTVSDTVYRADGEPAQGTLIITWPAFVTATGTAVAAGVSNVTIGANGALSVALVPNTGATPAGVYFTVVYQLGPADVRTEFWVVPTASPANLATVRVTPGTGMAAQPVSIQYVNTALATKANDNSVVHLSGAETIAGTKIFSTTPSVPAPTHTGDVANKSYVDGTVECLNASTWTKESPSPAVGPQP